MGAMREYQDIPALSASGAFELSETCPALYWAHSPFNPERLSRPDKREFDIGTAAHLAVLEPDVYSERVYHLLFDDFRTQAARDARDEAIAFDMVALKPSEVKIVDGVRDAIERRPYVMALFRGGVAEKTIVWGDDPPCKCRPDYFFDNTIIDLKTVSSAHPKTISRAAARDGWHVRVPWYREGVLAGLPLLDLPLSYKFVCVEKTKPYLIQVYEMSPRALAWGEQIIRRSLRLWRWCRASNFWPGYAHSHPGGKALIDLPMYEEYALADREAEGEFADG